MTPESLGPADQIHGGGLAATVKHASLIPFGPDTRVLDIGCGIGGPARYFAATFGCRVTGIDLTADYIDAARLLTGKMGLQDRIDFECADATKLPFEDDAFDVVWSQNVTMNIEDRAALFAGVHRVLRPGGIFTLTELALGPNGAPAYPLPWARDPSYSFLIPPTKPAPFWRPSPVSARTAASGARPSPAKHRPRPRTPSRPRKPPAAPSPPAARSPRPAAAARRRP